MFPRCAQYTFGKNFVKLTFVLNWKFLKVKEKKWWQKNLTWKKIKVYVSTLFLLPLTQIISMLTYLNTGILLQTKFVKTVKIEERDNNFNGNAEI